MFFPHANQAAGTRIILVINHISWCVWWRGWWAFSMVLIYLIPGYSTRRVPFTPCGGFIYHIAELITGEMVLHEIGLDTGDIAAIFMVSLMHGNSVAWIQWCYTSSVGRGYITAPPLCFPCSMHWIALGCFEVISYNHNNSNNNYKKQCLSLSCLTQ